MSQRSLSNTFRMNNKGKNQVSYSNQRKPRNIMSSSRRKFDFSHNEESKTRMNDSTSQAITAKIYHTGSGTAKNLKMTSDNPLSPRTGDTLKRHFSNSNSQIFNSPGNHSYLRKNSKVMKKFYEETKGYRSSRNLGIERKTKNNTQLLPVSSRLRNTSSKLALGKKSRNSKKRTNLNN